MKLLLIFLAVLAAFGWCVIGLCLWQLMEGHP